MSERREENSDGWISLVFQFEQLRPLNLEQRASDVSKGEVMDGLSRGLLFFPDFSLTSCVEGKREKKRKRRNRRAYFKLMSIIS